MEPWESDLVAEVRRLAREKFAERAEQTDREGTFARENVEDLRALRLGSMAFPRSLGGMDISV
jgi:alkylation response protein AidB-like acyl-CoA dehydrogenase